MGNNQVYLLNETEDSLRCLTFNNSDMFYWIPRAYLQLPPRQMVTADGLQGGGAVKVGIVYREDMEEGTSYFDLFQVNHGEVLIIKASAMGNNVTYIKNKTDHRIKCVTFNGLDIIYKVYRDRLTLDPGEKTVVKGLPGAGGVKVGVIIEEHYARSCFDLFWVYHGHCLKVKEMSTKKVTDFSGATLMFRPSSVRDSLAIKGDMQGILKDAKERRRPRVQ